MPLRLRAPAGSRTGRPPRRLLDPPTAMGLDSNRTLLPPLPVAGSVGVPRAAFRTRLETRGDVAPIRPRGPAQVEPRPRRSTRKAVRNVRIVQEVSSGAGTMIRRLLAFGRPPAAEWRSQGVNALVRSTMAAPQGPLGRDLEVVLDLKADPDEVIADARLLAQALLNLAVNARDAMPQGGELRLETRRIRSDSPPFERIRLRVADNGVGMEPAVKQRAFEPFFTTKDPERGSGLGLAAVQGIVEQHGGTIRAESEPGRGTAFEIDLPAAAPRG